MDFSFLPTVLDRRSVFPLKMRVLTFTCHCLLLSNNSTICSKEFLYVTQIFAGLPILLSLPKNSFQHSPRPWVKSRLFPLRVVSLLWTSSMLLLNQMAKLPLAGVLPLKLFDFGIEKLKAAFLVRLEKFPLSPISCLCDDNDPCPVWGLPFSYASSFLCDDCVSFPNLQEKFSCYLLRPL